MRMLKTWCVTLALLAPLGCEAPPDHVRDDGWSDIDGRQHDADGDDGKNDAGVDPECEPVRGEPALTLEPVVMGLQKPVFATFSPDGRMFVLEQHAGRIRIVEDGEILDEPFLDIGPEIAKGFEQGLLGLAFHPDYAQSGRFFINYTESGTNATRVQEWQVSADDPSRADSLSRRDLLVVPRGKNYHNGGHIAFGPDGYLYIGFGDGGPQCDIEDHAQDLGLLLGKMLRIDVNATEGDLPYAIPDDNPFVDDPDARPEIWAFGLRNPWSWSFDTATGHLYIGDVGFADYEEIDVIPAGTASAPNFGWPNVEGDGHCLEQPFCDEPCDATGTALPIYEYSHGEGRSVSAGYVYRGCRMPGHHGKFFFADFAEGWVRSLTYSQFSEPAVGNIIDWPSLAPPDGEISGFAQDREGELYILDHKNGVIYKIVPDLSAM